LQPEEIIEGFGKSNCGFISELGRDPDWERVIHAIDINKDGLIDYDEFMTAAADRLKLLTQWNLEAAFKVLDVNGDGEVTAEEMQLALSRGHLSTHSQPSDVNRWKKLVNEVDTNNDGAMDFEEFKTYMMDLIKQGGYMTRTSSLKSQDSITLQSPAPVLDGKKSKITVSALGKLSEESD